MFSIFPYFLSKKFGFDVLLFPLVSQVGEKMVDRFKNVWWARAFLHFAAEFAGAEALKWSGFHPWPES